MEKYIKAGNKAVELLWGTYGKIASSVIKLKHHNAERDSNDNSYWKELGKEMILLNNFSIELENIVKEIGEDIEKSPFFAEVMEAREIMSESTFSTVK